MISNQSRGLTVVLFIVAILLLPAPARTQHKAFSGLYAGVEVGRQNLIGGSLVDNVDFLTQDTRRVIALQGGVRYQFDVGFVIGVEGSVGFMDGKLSLADPANQLDITYDNDQQTTFGLMSGFALGPRKRWLLFAYLSEATRKFDVTVNRAGTTFQQSDEQGFLRYGIGVEKQLFGHLNLRATAGSGRADFADRQTNIDVKREFEFSVGGVLQL